MVRVNYPLRWINHVLTDLLVPLGCPRLGHIAVLSWERHDRASLCWAHFRTQHYAESNLLILNTKTFVAVMPKEVIGLIREALAIFRQLGDYSWATTMLIFLSLAQEDSLEGVREARTTNAEAMEMAEEIGSTFHRLILWSNAAAFSHFLGDYDQALLYSRRALNLSRRNGRSVEDDYWIIFTLSCVATLQGYYLLGAQLAGAHDGIEERATEPLGRYWSQIEIDSSDNNRVLLREALGNEEYERAIATGKNLNPNRIYDLAMGRSEPVR
jgi:tetratricopeptide (TPR) repeat protein